MATLRPYEVVTVAQGQNLRMRFRFWVARYGVSRLARSLGTNRETVHTWAAPRNSVTPDIRFVRTMLALSTLEPLVGCAYGDGALNYEDILGEVEIVTRETHTEATSAEMRNRTCSYFLSTCHAGRGC